MLINFCSTPNGSQNFSEPKFWQLNFDYQPIRPSKEESLTTRRWLPRGIENRHQKMKGLQRHALNDHIPSRHHCSWDQSRVKAVSYGSSTDCLGMWFGGHGVSRNSTKLVVPAVHANHLLFSSLYLDGPCMNWLVWATMTEYIPTSCRHVSNTAWRSPK